jgi:glycosyltransferase involved in cell wall biosynthesis
MSFEPALDISVAVCTCRPNQLAALLNSARGLILPSGLKWEVIVVDDRDDDASAKVVDGFSSSLPIRRFKPAKPGVSMARNRAVQEARGKYICWADDDTLLDRNWLVSYLAAFERHPEAAIFGGQILPRLEEPVPAWIRRSARSAPLACVFARREFAAIAPVRHERDHTPWGANFAVRAAEQKRFEYNVALGVSPERNRYGEESDVLFRMLASGCTGWWVPESKVRHIIPASRQTLSYFTSYFRRAGETAAFVCTTLADDCEASALQRRLLGLNRRRLRLGAAGQFAGFVALSALGVVPAGLGFLSRAAFYAGAIEHLNARASRSRAQDRTAVMAGETAS